MFFDTKINTDAFDEIEKEAQASGKKVEKAVSQTTNNVEKDVEGAAKKAKDKVKETSEAAKEGLSTINDVSKKLLMGVVGAGAAALGAGIAYNSQIENYTAGFETMLGSAEAADKMLSGLKGFAEKTPFEMSDLAQASTTLLAFGEDINDLMPDLQMLGDISLGNKEKFNGLALVFGQVKSQGKLMGQDLLQMINQGFNPLQIISEKTGESVSSLKDKMAKGQISFEMVADAMRTATSEGGKFYNAMDKQSKTFSGQVSTLTDNIGSLLGEMAEGVSKELTEDVLPDAIAMVEDLKQAWADGTLQEALSLAVSGITAFAGGIAALNIIMVANDIIQLKKGTEGYVAATKLGTTAQKLFNIELLKNPYTLLAVGLTALVAGVTAYALTHESAAKKIKESHDEAIKSIAENKAAELAQAETAKVLKDRLYELEGQIKSGTLSESEAKTVQEDFNGTAKQLEEIIPGITTAIYDETGAINIQIGKVEALTQSYYDLARAKAMVNAYQSYIDQTAKDLVEVEEKLKPYESGEKDKTHYSSYLGMDIVDYDYAELIKLREQYNLDMKGYITNLNTWQNQAAENSTDKTKEEEKKKTGIVTSGNKERTKSTSKAYEEDLRNLKHYHETGKLSDEEYYLALTDFRDKYFEEGSEEWQTYTKEIYNYTSGLCDKVIDEVKNLSQKLKGFGDLFTTKTDTYTLFDVDGNDVSMKHSYVELGDIGKQNEELQKYSDTLLKLKERGNIPAEFFAALRNLDVEEGTMFAQALLDADDETYNKYIEDWKKKQELSDSIAKDLYADEAGELRKKLEDEFGAVPEKFLDYGADSAKNFGKGFEEQISSVMQGLVSKMQIDVSNMTPIGTMIMGNGTLGFGAINNYYSEYNLLPSDNSDAAQLEAIRRQDRLNKMRGGY